MIKTLLYTVRGAIAWMTLGAILDGISGLLLVSVILNWSTGDNTSLILLILSSLTALSVTFIATQKGYLAGGTVMNYLATALIRHLPLSLKPVKAASHLLSGPASQIMSIPAHLLHPIISGIITPLTVVIGLIIYQFVFGSILLLIGIALLFILRFCAKQISHAEQKVYLSQQQVISALDSFSIHQPLIRRAGISQNQQQNLELALNNQYQTQKQLQNQSLPFHLFFSLSIQIIFIGLFCAGILSMMGIFLVNNTMLTLNSWLAGMLLLARFIEPLWLLSHLDQSLRQSKKSITQIEQVLKTDALSFPEKSQYPKSNDVSCHALSHYHDDKKLILSNISLTFKENTFTAIVGPSGAGKSSLLSLLARLQDPVQGNINYGNKEVTQLSQQVLCKIRGILFRDSRLFRGSVRQNLSLGTDNNNHNIDDREIRLMLSKLNFDADDELLDRDVGTDGMAFSGGQRQRLCIARLLLNHPDIIFMDEPTASLDYINTASVINLLTEANQQTRIIVTHQPNLAQQANNIICMDNGHVIDQGSHCELIARNPWYQQFIHHNS